MTKAAWDVMVDDETYQLLEDYFGTEMELSDVISNADRAGIIRLLDSIVEDVEGFGGGDEEMAVRARAARTRVQRS